MKGLAVFLAVFAINLNISLAQTPEDIEKMNSTPVFSSSNNTSRSGTPGCDCENTIPLSTGEFQFLPTTNTNLPNIINNITPGFQYPGCLGSAPNQTWFEFTSPDTGGVTIVVWGQVDYDYILFDATDFPCEEFNTFTGQFQPPPILSCSYSTSPVENFNFTLFGGRRYILVVTNFSNIPAPFLINVYAGIEITPFSSKSVIGRVYADNNDNCIFDDGDSPIANALVEYSGTIIYDETLADGTYKLLLPGNADGQVQISQSTVPNLLWSNNCSEFPATFTVDFPENDTLFADVPYSSTIDCALPVVQTSVPFLRRCFTNPRVVQYCNYGTETLPPGEIILHYDEGIIPISFSTPYSFDGEYYSIAINGLSPGECGSFQIVDSVTCENGLGSYGCVEASYVQVPDCYEFSAEWDGSDLTVDAICSDSTTATFTVINVGSSAMSQSMPYELKRNGQVEETGNLQLNAGESAEFSYTNDDDLLTFAVWETPNNPFNILAWDLSDCNSNINFGGNSISYAIQDQQPWLDIDCDLIIGSYDPNDKFAWPFGQGESLKVERDDEIEYRIRFQNTGNDTAFAVVIVDTLSDMLDVESLRFTGNSHNYSYELVDRVLTVTFNPIILPDSSTNLDESIGYVKFALKQNEDNPNNYVIENFADIYFDFNPPIRTNTEIRTIGEVALNIESIGSKNIKLYPVPASNIISIELPANDDFSSSIIHVYDLSGRKLIRQDSKSLLNTLNTAELSSGIYLLEVINNKGRAERSPFVVQH